MAERRPRPWEEREEEPGREGWLDRKHPGKNDRRAGCSQKVNSQSQSATACAEAADGLGGADLGGRGEVPWGLRVTVEAEDGSNAQAQGQTVKNKYRSELTPDGVSPMSAEE